MIIARNFFTRFSSSEDNAVVPGGGTAVGTEGGNGSETGFGAAAGCSVAAVGALSAFESIESTAATTDESRPSIVIFGIGTNHMIYYAKSCEVMGTMVESEEMIK